MKVQKKIKINSDLGEENGDDTYFLEASQGVIYLSDFLSNPYKTGLKNARFSKKQAVP